MLQNLSAMFGTMIVMRLFRDHAILDADMREQLHSAEAALFRTTRKNCIEHLVDALKDVMKASGKIRSSNWLRTLKTQAVHGSFTEDRKGLPAMIFDARYFSRAKE